jgi:TetR/AcrR family transcriptional regulator, repressor of fatR-cypB operon
MARITDDSKLERIKDAAMQLVVAKGYGGASISEIAKTAKVAEGYLYRHYKSKSDLIEDLLYKNINELIDKFENLTNSNHPVLFVFDQLVRTLFEIANHDPIKIKLLYVLMNDYNFVIQEKQRKRIQNLCKKVKENGHASGEINSNVDEEEIYLLAVTYPIQFINLRLKGFFNKAKLGEPEIKKVLHVCFNSIKR